MSCASEPSLGINHNHGAHENKPNARTLDCGGAAVVTSISVTRFEFFNLLAHKLGGLVLGKAPDEFQLDRAARAR